MIAPSLSTSMRTQTIAANFDEAQHHFSGEKLRPVHLPDLPDCMSADTLYSTESPHRGRQYQHSASEAHMHMQDHSSRSSVVALICPCEQSVSYHAWRGQQGSSALSISTALHASGTV